MTNHLLEEMCKHGFETPIVCPICKGNIDEPRKSDMVYVSEYGESYHQRPDCPALLFGQEKVSERGGTPAPIELVSEDSVKFDRKRCRSCFRKRK